MRMSIDQWEELPWWQQRALLTARNRAVERDNARIEKQNREQGKANRGKVAGRKGKRPGSPGRTGDEQRPRPTSGGRTKLKDSPLWAGRKTRPATLPRMTGQDPRAAMRAQQGTTPRQ